MYKYPTFSMLRNDSPCTPLIIISYLLSSDKITTDKLNLADVISVEEPL